jgi:hypothetical protein
MSLAQKANEGQLAPEEAREYERFIDVSDIISTLRLKAERQAHCGSPAWGQNRNGEPCLGQSPLQLLQRPQSRNADGRSIQSDV